MASALRKKIFVGPTPTTLMEQTLITYFSRYGSIEALELVSEERKGLYKKEHQRSFKM